MVRILFKVFNKDIKTTWLTPFFCVCWWHWTSTRHCFIMLIVNLWYGFACRDLTIKSYLNKLSKMFIFRSSHRMCSIKKGILRNFSKFTGKHLCQSLFFNKVAACHFIKKETLAQVFSCEFWEISKNIFFTEHVCLDDCFFILNKNSVRLWAKEWQVI